MIHHQGLTADKWSQFEFVEKMANMGSEVERAINWKLKKNFDYSWKAFERALELIDLTLETEISYPPRLRELCRVREVFVDYFYGDNEFNSTDESWKKYFLAFAYAARKNH